MKKKLTLKQLEIKSFVTGFDNPKKNVIKGRAINGGQVFDPSIIVTYCFEDCPPSYGCTHTCPPTFQQGCGDTTPSPTDGCGGLSDNTCVTK